MTGSVNLPAKTWNVAPLLPVSYPVTVATERWQRNGGNGTVATVVIDTLES